MNFFRYNSFLVTPARFFKFFFKNLIWEMPTKEKKIWLTFDDGPDPIFTTEILNILDKYSIKATFFLEGEKVAKYPYLVEQIKKTNHSIGNHTNSHLNGWKTSTNTYLKDVYKAQKVIKSSLFRPPFGKIKISQIKNLIKDFKIIMWSIMPLDFSNKISDSEFKDNILKNVKKGSIIVLHCNSKSHHKVCKNLPDILEELLKREYEFCSTW